LTINNQLLQKICRGKVCRTNVFGQTGAFQAKYPSHPQKCACSYTFASIDGFSDWSGASVYLSEHGKSSCHLHAGVQWFEAEQRLTKVCSLDSIDHIYDLPLHQSFTVFCLFASVNM